MTSPKAEINSPDVREYLRIRSYRITDHRAKRHTISQPGRWIITPQGEVHPAYNESNEMLASLYTCLFLKHLNKHIGYLVACRCR
jgi:hypothetical protein